MWPGLTKAAKAGGKPPSEAVPQLRAGKQMLETVAYQQSLVEEVSLSPHLDFCLFFVLLPIAVARSINGFLW